MLLMKAIFNAILAYGTLPISSNCFGRKFINELEIFKEEQ